MHETLKDVIVNTQTYTISPYIYGGIDDTYIKIASRSVERYQDP